ncbi:hypothetical protein HOH87_02295 [bacterium]|nr:hypothetical protein [bacterium]
MIFSFESTFVAPKELSLPTVSTTPVDETGTASNLVNGATSRLSAKDGGVCRDQTVSFPTPLGNLLTRTTNEHCYDNDGKQIKPGTTTKHVPL